MKEERNDMASFALFFFKVFIRFKLHATIKVKNVFKDGQRLAEK